MLRPLRSSVFLLEMLCWLATGLLVWLVLRPIHQAMFSWTFERWNVAYIVVLVTLARYTFLLKHTWFARIQLVKIGFFLAMLPLAFLLVSGLNEFMNFIEDTSWEPLTGHLPAAERAATEKYIWNEMLFFAVGAILATPVFAVRLFMAIWRQQNRDTV